MRAKALHFIYIKKLEKTFPYFDFQNKDLTPQKNLVLVPKKVLKYFPKVVWPDIVIEFFTASRSDSSFPRKTSLPGGQDHPVYKFLVLI